MRCAILTFLLVFSTVLWAAAEDEPQSLTKLDQPVAVARVDRDGQTLIGALEAYGPRGFVVVDQAGDEQQIDWSTLSDHVGYTTYRGAMNKTSGDDWLALGELLMELGDGALLGESALQVAVAFNPDLADAAQAARVARAEAFPATQPALLAQAGDIPIPESEEAASGPQPTVTWGDVQPEQFDELVEKDKQFALEAAAKMGFEFNLVETDYFLFYTTLPAEEAYEWQRVLDLMYKRVSYLLDIPEGVNIWKGKALVFMLDTKDQFVAFEKKIFKYTVTYAAGLCHGLHDGAVRIVFYQLEDKKYLKQLMIHEAAHGVIHRYRSPQRIPSWINEGIAEWTASSVLQYNQPFKATKRKSAIHIKKKGKLGFTFFQKGNIPVEYYGTALAMPELLLRRSRAKYLDFIDGIKNGQAWEESLQTTYDLTPAELVTLYGKSIGMPRLRQ